jgi:iron complex transport system substrate-binding protein
MRRAFLAALAAAALVTVAACGSDDEPDSPESGGASGSTGSAFPVTVDTMFGGIEIPEEPKKIVALGWADAETLYALGVQPIAMSDWLGFGGDGVGPWAEDLVEEPAEQLGTLELDYDRINELEPDLILNTRSDNSEETYDKLDGIAPTVYGPEGVTAYGTSWEQQVTIIAQAVGKVDEGAKLIADTKAQFAATAAEYPALAGKTAAVGALFGTNQWGAYVSGDLRVDFLTELGMKNKPEIEAQKEDSFFVSVSAENLQILDADVTIMFALGDNKDALASNPVINNLASTKAGHLLVLETDDADAYSTGSIPAIQYALETVVPKIADAAGA